MKKLTVLSLIALSILSCSKSKTCYQCQAANGPNVYDEKVCTDGDPKAKLTKTDAYGNIQWHCTER